MSIPLNKLSYFKLGKNPVRQTQNFELENVKNQGLIDRGLVCSTNNKFEGHSLTFSKMPCFSPSSDPELNKNICVSASLGQKIVQSKTKKFRNDAHSIEKIFRF